MSKRKNSVKMVKPIWVVLLLFLSMTILLACKKKETIQVVDKETSYAFGMLLANQLKGQMGLDDLHFDYDAFMEGFKDYNEANETRITQEIAMERINALFTLLQSRQEEELWLKGAKYREEGELYVKENGARPGVFTTSSGLQYEVLVQGSGEKPGPDSLVRVNYEGSFLSGEVFDSSFDRGPVEFRLDMVIPGWGEGLQLMNEGSTFNFVIPPELGYGVQGSGPIPPYSTLLFKVELIAVIR